MSGGSTYKERVEVQPTKDGCSSTYKGVEVQPTKEWRFNLQRTGGGGSTDKVRVEVQPTKNVMRFDLQRTWEGLTYKEQVEVQPTKNGVGSTFILHVKSKKN